MPYGIAPKFGRFLSSIGYLNDQHQHVWDFYDAPLVYQAFLGGQYQNNGLQVKWIAPTDTFVEFGAEVGSGESFPGNSRNKNGVGDGTAYVHAGGDIGASNSWRAGLSYLQTGAKDREYTQTDLAGNDALVAFSGRSKVAIADFVWKWAPNGNAQERNFKLQGEYFWRRESGDLTYDSDGYARPHADRELPIQPERLLRRRASGSSSRPGASARATTGSIRAASTTARTACTSRSGSFNPQRTAVMLDWTPSEFSRFRVQYQQAKLRPDVTDNEIFVQYILTLGAHGAHKF